MAKKPAKKPAKSKTVPAAKPAKRYKATPEDVSDRQHLINVIQAGAGCTAKAAKETMDDLIETITASLKKNQKLQLVGFGSFTVTKWGARKGRNPQTGETNRIKASKSVRFKNGQALKRAL
jgi:DNA-binding protein HU-beta